VILYGDTVTRSMQQTLDETGRRRQIQEAYNDRHGITPATIHKTITHVFDFMKQVDSPVEGEPVPLAQVAESVAAYGDKDADVQEIIREMEAEMEKAARELAFERAADLRDRIAALKASV
jgi:excinuclease ABC subunit B